jgi:hypothetical protein
MSLTLAILVPCLSSRPWHKVVKELDRQCLPFKNKVRVFHLVDDGEMTSGVKRQALCDLSEVKASAYRCFVDDDDRVTPDYVKSILEGCDKGVDVVSFVLEFNHYQRARRERWSYGLYPNNRRLGRMCVNHLCAWRTEIADRVAWCPKLGYGDDHLWFQPLFHAGLIQYHVGRVLYNYLYSPMVTANQKYGPMTFARSYVGRGLACFLTPEGEILIQDGHDAPDGKIDLRDRNNVTHRRTVTKQLMSYHYHNATVA